MNIEFRRGWRPLLASGLGTAAGILSITFYTQGLFVGPVTAEFGWTRTEFFLGFAIMQLIGAITAPAVGTVIDRLGPRIVGITGLLGHAAIYLALSWNPGSLWVFYLTWASLAVWAAGSLPITWMTVVTGWFHENRGLAIGLTMAGTGLSATLAPRYAQFLIDVGGWRAAYAGLGLTALVLSLPIVIGYFREAPDCSRLAVPTAGNAGRWGLTRAQAIRGRRFWVLGTALFVITVSVIGLIANFVPLLLDRGWSAPDAARIAAILGLAVIAGRLVAGYLVDRLWAPAVAAMFFSGPALATALMTNLPMTQALALAAAILLGLAAGAELDLLAYLTSRYFGLRHYGAVFGGIYAFFTVGSGLAPLAYARAFDVLGTYRPMLGMASVAIVVAVGMLLTLGPYPSHPTVAPTAGGQESAPR